jgi:hypothetical protein
VEGSRRGHTIAECLTVSYVTVKIPIRRLLDASLECDRYTNLVHEERVVGQQFTSELLPEQEPLVATRWSMR